MLKIKDLFKKFFLLITSLFLLGSCSYIDAQFNTNDLPLVGGLFLSKNDPVNIDIVESLELEIGESVELYSMRSEGESKYTNIPVRWSLINDIGSMTIYSGGTRAQFSASSLGLGHIEIEENGVTKRININIVSSTNSGEITLSTPVTSNITDSGFDVNVSFSNDDNSNASAILYYCNETATPSCDPLVGTSVAMTTSSNQFSASVSSLTNSDEDQYRFLIVVTDSDGVNNAPSAIITQLLRVPETPIYRSVGSLNTSALDTFTSGTMTISGSHASFSSPIAENIGVGDVIVFNSSANYAIISGRTDSQNFTVFLADGKSSPTSVTNDSTWEIYRAYTSLDDAEKGDENTGIPNIAELAGGKNFDSWSGGRDLVTNNEQWNIILYADADDSGYVTINGWITSEDHFLKVYTPVLSNEVGISQRHNGTFSSGYLFNGILRIRDVNVHVDGIAIDRTSISLVEGAFTTDGINESNGFITLENSLVRSYYVDDGENAVHISDSGQTNVKFSLINNIVIGIDANAIFIRGGSNTTYVYNNTTYSKSGRSLARSNGSVYFINNIAISDGRSTGIINDGLIGTSIIVSSNNISNVGIHSDFSDPTNRANQEVYFNSKEAYDFRLAGNSYSAIGRGADLSGDSNYSFTMDILGNTRTRWDIGATTAPTALFRSIGPSNTSSLKGICDRELSISINSDGHTQMNLSGGSTDLALNVGVGDVIQYDEDNNGSLDNLAFISQRIDQNNYIVKAADGTNAQVTSVNSTNWDIFRAYTSLANVNNATENTGLDAGLSDFDSSSRLDLVSNNTQLFLPLYADAANGAWWLNNFTSYDNNFIRVFSPFLSSEVGVSQRHSGVWDNTKSRIIASNYFGIIYMASGSCSNCRAVRIDGIQVENSQSGSGEGHGIYFNGRNTIDTFYFSNNIIRKTADQRGSGIKLVTLRSHSYFVNNIIYDFEGGITHRVTGSDGAKAIIYNNTIDNSSTRGVYLSAWGTNDRIYLKNNILKDSSTSDFDSQSTIETFVTDANLTYDLTSPDGASFQSQTVSFVDSLNEDYRLQGGDTGAMNRGVDLSLDHQYFFETNIQGTTRSTWNIGAH